VQYSKTIIYLSLNVRLTNCIIEKNAGVCDVLIYNDAANHIRDDVNRWHDLNQISLLFVAQSPPLSVT